MLNYLPVLPWTKRLMLLLYWNLLSGCVLLLEVLPEFMNIQKTLLEIMRRWWSSVKLLKVIKILTEAMKWEKGGFSPNCLDFWSSASLSAPSRSTFKHTVLYCKLQTKLSISQAVVLQEVVWCHGNTVQIPLSTWHSQAAASRLCMFQTQKATKSRNTSSSDRLFSHEFMMSSSGNKITSLRSDYSLEAALPSWPSEGWLWCSKTDDFWEEI